MVLPKKFINVGEIHIAIKPTEIITILGSCVAVCLFDTRQNIAGMSHYLVPLWNGNGLESPKYGNISVEKLIEGMYERGSKKFDLVAKVFGGANINIKAHDSMLIGKKNVIIAEEILAKHGIKIAASDTGGNRGRRIMLQSDTGKIFLKYTSSSNG